MALHLVKLCVGAASVADLEARIAARPGAGMEHIHVTRMIPKRLDELLDGGSLYWVIRGQTAVRQPLIAVRPFRDGEGVARCELVLEPGLVAVEPHAFRPFQGWRYLDHDNRPGDLSGSGVAHLPEPLRFALRELCLL